MMPNDKVDIDGFFVTLPIKNFVNAFHRTGDPIAFSNMSGISLSTLMILICHFFHCTVREIGVLTSQLAINISQVLSWSKRCFTIRYTTYYVIVRNL